MARRDRPEDRGFDGRAQTIDMYRRIVIAVLTMIAAVLAGSAAFACRAVEPAPVIPSSEAREAMPQTAALEVQYIANEGVLISSRDKRVLIDGLHRKYDDAYAFLPDVERNKIEAAKPPFDKIDLILVSHIHGDHFHPESVGLYLKNSPQTTLVTSQQVADQLSEKFAGFDVIRSRVKPVAYTLKSHQPMQVAGVDIEVLGVGHGSGRYAAIQNIGHLITLSGKKLLHIGDAEISDDIFDAFDLEKQSIDIAMLPYWFLTSKSGQALIEKHIRPKHIIAVHVGPGEAADIVRQVKQAFPRADVFRILLERRHF